MKLEISCALALALAAESTPAQQTLKVPSPLFPTIASAVGAASSGDTILVAANDAPGSLGVYSETVVVPNTKTGLHFKGSNTIWDGGAASDLLTFTGPNDGVTVEGFVFRNGGAHVTITGNNATIAKCVSIASHANNSFTITGNFATVTGVTIRGGLEDGIHVAGTDALIEKCGIDGLDFPAVRVLGGDRAVISSCKISRCVGGISAAGDDVAIVKNTINDTTGIPIVVTGQRARIQGNKILIASGGGISTGAATHDALVDSNAISGTHGLAISIDGAHATITKNKIDNVLGGIRVANGNTALLAGPTVSGNAIKACRNADAIDVSADSVTIAANAIDHVEGVNQGIQVLALGLSAQGGTIAGNKVSNCGNRGIDVLCDNVAITNNSVKRAGASTSTSGGFRITASNCSLLANTAAEIFGDGFLIIGNGNTLTACKASNCRFDGFDILAASDATTLDGCSATACDAEGLDNSAGVTGTAVMNCVFSKCRIDFAGNATLAVDLNNTFATGGAGTAPVVD